ncbi:S6 family peptidase, partial [Alysiella crassa]
MSKRNKTIRTKTSHTFQRSIIASLISVLATSAHASIVRSDIDYQYYRDFAENKGQFTVGARDITIYDKSGNDLGKTIKGMPMPDFSGVPQIGDFLESGLGIMMTPQYYGTVAHNLNNGVRFGQTGQTNRDAPRYYYNIADRNDFGNVTNAAHWDYGTPRLEKLVTEAVPIPIADIDLNYTALLDETRFPVFARIGAGRQYTIDAAGKEPTQVSHSYKYLTGGSILPALKSTTKPEFFDYNATQGLFTNGIDPLATQPRQGDSGSAILGFDTTINQWVTVSHHQSSGSERNPWGRSMIARKAFFNEQIKQDTAGHISNNVANARYDWTLNGANSSNITQSTHASNTLKVDLRDDSLTSPTTGALHIPSANHGKTVHISGSNGTLHLAQDINQGAGALYFDANFTVSGAQANTTWLGAGVSIAENKTVNWQVHNPKGDRLSKIGTGSLNVTGTGVNHGSISVGDGRVLLNQHADANDNTQAFSELGLTSGRGTVVLGNNKQINPNSIYFGSRGGTLDLNGNNLTFERIRNVDDGAKIVNNNMNKAASITISRTREFIPQNVIFETNQDQNYKPTGIYTVKRDGNRVDYYILNEGKHPFVRFPTTPGSSGSTWRFIATGTQEDAIDAFLKIRGNVPLSAKKDAFFGMLGDKDNNKNGRLDVNFNPTLKDDIYILNGGSNLNGNINVQNGTLVLSGTPTPHAYDYLTKPNGTPNTLNDVGSDNNGREVMLDHDWITRDFNATNINITSGSLKTSRNVGNITANITVSGNGRAELGFVNGETVYTRSLHTGITTAENKTYDDNILALIPNTRLNGNISLRDNATVRLNIEYDKNITANQNATVQLAGLGHWIMPSSQNIVNLDGDLGSQITLNAHQDTNSDPNNYHTLTLSGLLDGNIQFNYLSNLAAQKSDKLVINGYAAGEHKLYVQNTGAEANIDKLTLVELNSPIQNANDVSFQLVNGFVDAGTYRYTLKTDASKQYYLSNPRRAAELAKLREEEAKKAAEEAQKAKQALIDAENARKTAEDAQKRAEDALKQAQANSGVNATDLAAAQKAAEEARKLAEQANQDKQAAETQLNQVREQLAAAENAKVKAEQLKNAAEAQAQTVLADKNRLQNELNAANTAKQAAEQAKANAERDKQAAEEAKANAERDKQAAETAKANAERDKQAAEMAQAQAEALKNEALVKQQEAENKQREAETQKTAAQNALTEAERQKAAAEKALLDAQADGGKALSEAQKALENAQKQVADKERELTAAQNAQNQALTEKAEAERARDQAQAALNTANAAKQAAEQAKANAERETHAAQTAQASAELAKQAAEEAKANAEREKQAAETAKQTAEQNLTEAQTALTTAQAEKAAAEKQAREAEIAKNIAEQVQKELEQAQAAQNQALQTAQETARLAEEARANAEREKEHQAELARQAETAKQAAEAAQKLAEEAKNQAQTDLAAAETAKTQAEAAKVAAENAQKSAETARAEAEKSLQAALTAKTEAENAKNQAQTDLA